jgi:hypothetical protein
MILRLAILVKKFCIKLILDCKIKNRTTIATIVPVNILDPREDH